MRSSARQCGEARRQKARRGIALHESNGWEALREGPCRHPRLSKLSRRPWLASPCPSSLHDPPFLEPLFSSSFPSQTTIPPPPSTPTPPFDLLFSHPKAKQQRRRLFPPIFFLTRNTLNFGRRAVHTVATFFVGLTRCALTFNAHLADLRNDGVSTTHEPMQRVGKRFSSIHDTAERKRTWRAAPPAPSPPSPVRTTTRPYQKLGQFIIAAPPKSTSIKKKKKDGKSNGARDARGHNLKRASSAATSTGI